MDPAVDGYAYSVAIFAALRYLFCTSSLRGIWASSSSWDSDLPYAYVPEAERAGAISKRLYTEFQQTKTAEKQSVRGCATLK